MRLMRKQNGMIVPMKVSRWSISVWITDLKNSIGFLFFLLIFLSCGTKHTKYGDNGVYPRMCFAPETTKY